MAMSEVVIARFTLQHIEAKPGFAFVDMRRYWRGRVAELEAAEEKRDEAEAKPKPSEPDELQRLLDQMDRLGRNLALAVGQDVREIRSTLERLGEKLNELGDDVGEDRKSFKASLSVRDARHQQILVWAEKFASWSDEEHLVKSPRL